MQTTVARLQQVALLLLDHLKEQTIEPIEFEADFYWNIPSKELYEPRTTPRNLDLGQLSHDLERLEQIARGENEPIGQALIWLSSVLRYVGERNPT